MSNESVQADILWVKSRNTNLPIFRVVQTGSATVLWKSREQALTYLERLQLQLLQATTKGR